MLQCPTCGRQYAAEVVTCPEDGAALRADPTLQAAYIPLDPLVGRVLDDKYQLDERLGEGGMGTVYRATHLLIERPVAVKVLNSRMVTDEAARERFRREARAAGRLRHSNAVAVTDFGQTADGLVYIVMELLEGRTLREVLAREAPLNPARAVSLMLQTAAAVAAAHEAGVIHRDLKPGNVFVVQRPNAPHIVKVLDFGIAKLATDATDGRPDPPTLTETGVMIGTPRYMSPEQCDGQALTPASDVYSLGVILYEMLAGETPFSGATPLAVALKHSAEQPRRPSGIVPGIPAALEQVVLRALEKKPADRPADAGEFRRELYATAERLGLEHAAGFSAPTIDTLRDAGTETPSGRLVIDIERMRESRAAFAPDTAEAPAPPETAESAVVETGGKPSHSETPAAQNMTASPALPAAEAATPVTPAPQTAPPAESPDAASRRASRLRIPLRRGAGATPRSRPRQIPVWALAMAGLLLLGVVAAFVWRSSHGGGAGTDSSAGAGDDAVGRTLSSADVTPRASSVPREPRTAAEFYERGAYYFSSRNYDAAVEDYRRALELQPDFPVAHNRLGRALMMKGQFGAAAREFRAAVAKKGGDYPAASYNLGFTLQQQGDLDDALRAYAEAIDRSGGTYPDAHYQTGIIHLRRGGDAEAAAAMRRAIEQNKGRDPDAQFGLGVALARQKDYAGAESAFRAAIDGRGGDFADAHFNLALVYENTGRTLDAIREFETYLRQQPRGENRRLAENSIKALRRRAAEEGSNTQ